LPKKKEKKKDKKTSRKFGTYENSAKVFKRLTLASRSGNVDKRTNTIFFRTPAAAAAAAKKRSGREGRPHGGQSIGGRDEQGGPPRPAISSPVFRRVPVRRDRILLYLAGNV